jgi:hypothetical protein
MLTVTLLSDGCGFQRRAKYENRTYFAFFVSGSTASVDMCVERTWGFNKREMQDAECRVPVQPDKLPFAIFRLPKSLSFA